MRKGKAHRARGQVREIHILRELPEMQIREGKRGGGREAENRGRVPRVREGRDHGAQGEIRSLLQLFGLPLMQIHHEVEAHGREMPRMRRPHDARNQNDSREMFE